MASFRLLPLLFVYIALFLSCNVADDASSSYDFVVSYVTASPLGVPQQVIAINGQFPGPVINVTTNSSVRVNVNNKLDEDFLMTWAGVQQRNTCWQDGVPGTNCPITPKWEWTYHIQAIDQIGSFIYFPSLNFQRAAGGFGGIIINNRDEIPVHFATPDGDIPVMIGDWYTSNHTVLRTILDGGKDLDVPDGVLINGKGPYRFDDTLVPDGIEYETIDVHPGKTYRLRVSNVGISTSLNFRIQNHNLLLAETEGTFTVQHNYTNFDIHVGQSYSFLVTMDQNASADYYIVASARFVDESVWRRVTGVAILHYSNSKGKAAGPLPESPRDQYNTSSSMNQAKSIRRNVSASDAHPFASLNVTDVYVLKNKSPVTIDGKRRTTLNGVTFVNPQTPFGLADKYRVQNVYTADFPNRPITGSPYMATKIINVTVGEFMEVIFVNGDSKMQSYHIDGYAFFVVGMSYGEWTESSRGIYNKRDAIARVTTQVFPGAWTAVLISLDNVGFWNIRAENLDTWYLGQETYVKVVDPDATYKTQLSIPDNVLYCGALYRKQRPLHNLPPSATSKGNESNLLFLVLLLTLFLLP